MSSFSLLALAALPLLSQFAQAQSCTPKDNIKLTYYGYPDGPGDTTSFGCSGTTMVASTAQNPPKAGGSGSYSDPFTMATMAGSTNIKECELVYIPYMKKYFRYMDHCSGCDSNHIDLWIGTDTNGGATQITCEQNLGTTQQTIIVNPPNGLDVDAQNFWDGTCHTDQFFPNPNTNVCSGGSTGGSTGGASSSAAAAPPPASSSTAPAPQATSSAAVQPTPAAAQQPSSAASAPSQTPSKQPAKGAVQKQAVQPTTLLTIASSVVSTNEPTGTPLATSNGVCETAGAAVCSFDGSQIGICNIDKTVVFMDVAKGTKCANGGLVFANA